MSYINIYQYIADSKNTALMCVSDCVLLSIDTFLSSYYWIEVIFDFKSPHLRVTL